MEFARTSLFPTSSSSSSSTLNNNNNNAPTTHGGGTSPSPPPSAAASDTDPESGVSPGEGGRCPDHGSDMDWFCISEQKMICSHCAAVGSCLGHSVTRLATRVTAVRNQLVDVCEKIQLQALRIERFVSHTLAAKERALQVEASRAREHVLAQRSHWGQALSGLTQTRTRLTAGQEITERVEEAEGVGDPCDSDKLNLNPACSDSRLLKGLWAGAVLLGPAAYGSADLQFDERTVSPLLGLSEDRCTVTFLPKRPRQSPAYDPSRFDSWPNVLGTAAMSSGTHNWVTEVGQSGAYKVGVCYQSVERKGSGNGPRLGYSDRSWVLSHYDGDYTFCHAGKHRALSVVRRPQRVGVLLDWPSRTLLFYEPDSAVVLHSLTHAFDAPLLAACAVADRSATLLH
ncbi:hypothetical protein NHX12_027733 [Muraenolepis orangiensis]|uniref:B30.2/SPRY domain-containing protein n=1 Tax=Muraenolepis orangiensis TaxID=630683 RepID=A0A9Q0EE67_9TELE|nr:hypothetical protein NHX12_027733 [Muraenolepis orangiensis]